MCVCRIWLLSQDDDLFLAKLESQMSSIFHAFLTEEVQYLCSLYQEEELKLCIIDQKPLLHYEHICHENTAKYVAVVAVYFERYTFEWIFCRSVLQQTYYTLTLQNMKLTHFFHETLHFFQH